MSGLGTSICKFRNLLGGFTHAVNRGLGRRNRGFERSDCQL